MKYIVTGGGGFIGSHLSEKLVKLGHKVTVIDNFSVGRKDNLKNIKKKIKIINADIRNKHKISKHFKNIDGVFHLAALADIVPSIENPDLYLSTNVNGTFNVLSCSLENKVKRFIYVASSSSYGIPKIYPTPENSPINAEYPYALTKRMGEELTLHFAKVFKLNATSLRFFNVYGPRARTSGTYGAMFGVFLAQKIASKPFTVVGDGNQSRDFTYVSDVVDALIITAKKKNISGDYFNVGSGQTVTVNKVIKLLKGKFVKIPKRPGEPDITYADISKIKNKIGWKPKVPIQIGINLLLENIESWKNSPVWTPKGIKRATKKWFFYLNKKK